MNATQNPHLRTAPGPRAQAFGPEYEELLLTIWQKTPFRFPFDSNKNLRAFRAKVYAYFRQLRNENLRLDLIEMADGLTLTIDNNVLVFVRNAETWDHNLIRKTLGLSKDRFGLKPNAPGSELQVPDLHGTRLAAQLRKLRERNAGGSAIVPPMKSDK